MIRKYVMIIDLNKCVRCRTGYIACKRENKIIAHPKDNEHPYEYYALRYLEWEYGKYPFVERTFIPIHCMHCKDPRCVKFCPQDAIIQNEEGIVQINQDKCNGCGVCAAVCPYGAIYIGPDGKAGMCDFCYDRLKKGKLPKCVETCSGEARIFGDLNDPDDRVYKIVNSGKAKPLLLNEVEETRVYYIPSKHERNFEKLPYDRLFQKTLKERKKDLPPVKGSI